MYLTNTELATFFDQMSMILHSGISSIEGLSIMKEDAYTKEGEAILQNICDEMEITGNLYTALSSSGAFPSYALELIRIGEQTGHLENVMRSLSQYYQQEENIRQSIKSVVTYPLIMLGMMFIVILVLIIKVLPMFNQVFIQLGSEMSSFSIALMNIGKTLSKYSFAFILLLVLVAALFIYFSYIPSGIRTRRSIAARFFLTKTIVEKMAVSKFAAGMSLTLSSGLDIHESLSMSSALIENALVRQRVDTCREYIENGMDFPEALTKTGIFSGIYSKMISIGYKAGALDDLMEKISRQYENEINDKMDRLISVLEPALVALLSVIVGLILLSVMLPLLGIMTNIG